MQAADLHHYTRHAFLWALGAAASIAVTVVASVGISFFDQGIWAERARLLFYLVTATMTAGCVTTTMHLYRMTAPPAAHREEEGA